MLENNKLYEIEPYSLKDKEKMIIFKKVINDLTNHHCKPIPLVFLVYVASYCYNFLFVYYRSNYYTTLLNISVLRQSIIN